VLSKQLEAAVQQQVKEPVVIAMRYGNPSPQEAFEELMKKAPGLEEVVLLPLYPHYAMSSYETAAEYAKEVYRKKKYPFKLSIVKAFYDDPSYMEAMCDSLRPFLQQEYDHVLYSFHGVPERHIKKSDITHHHCLQSADCCSVKSEAHQYCYRHQCLDTAKRMSERLGIPDSKYSFSFQSRLGRDPWLLPFTATRLAQMPAEGIKKLVILCPAFVSDCLETLEEMGKEGREIFMHAGGESFTLVPCMNVHPSWVKAIVNLCTTI
jgi:ferrochelatase